ncbi:MAG TPA: adenosine kinase [Stellaceae bacterium]|nr:adenosine kinase [Stellaceae bacterium]
MTKPRLSVLGIGNAIVDIIADADDAFIARRGLTKGAMKLIDGEEAGSLYQALGIGAARESSGGSVANTIAGIAALGGKAGFIGKVRNDLLGKIFSNDLTSMGVVFPTKPATDGADTARCIILVTPDAQRTMNTYLGACASLGAEDIDADLVRSAEITYLEGYLYDPPAAKEAFHKAAEIAHAAGRKVALSLSDAFCVERHRAAFLDLVEKHVDILFANEAEITSLYQCDFDQAVSRVRGACGLAALTRSAEGSVVVTAEEVIAVPAAKVTRVIDTTGAGDLYAAGFLYGLTTGRSLKTCAQLGGLCAGEIISHYGARPEADLAVLVAPILIDDK